MKTKPTIPTAAYECGSLTHFIFKQSHPFFFAKEGENIYLQDGGGLLRAQVRQRYQIVVPAPMMVGVKLAPKIAMLTRHELTAFVHSIGFDLISEELEALALSQQPCDHDGMHHLALIVTELPV